MPISRFDSVQANVRNGGELPIGHNEFSATGRLFFVRGYAVAAKFALRTFAVSRLLAHRFAADLVLTNFADSAAQILRWLGADHTFFCRLTHDVFLSVQNFYLLGVFQNYLQPVLRMIFDKSADFYLVIFEVFWRLFAFFKKFRCGIEDHRRQCFA